MSNVIEIRFGDKFIYRIDYESDPVKLLLMPLDYDYVGQMNLPPEEIKKVRLLVIEVCQRAIEIVQKAVDVTPGGGEEGK